MSGRRVLVVGAGGNLGVRLVARGLAHGHRVTAFVRDTARFEDWRESLGIPPVPVVAGDGFDTQALAAAMKDQDAVVSAAGIATDGPVFAELFRCIVGVASRTLPLPRRLWMVASTAVLTIPNAGVIAAGLPGVPRMHRLHEADWRVLEACDADWSLMCPGPMTPARDGRVRQDLRVTTDVVPVDIPRWARTCPLSACRC